MSDQKQCIYALFAQSRSPVCPLGEVQAYAWKSVANDSC